MRYGATFLDNLQGASQRGDVTMQRDLITDQFGDLIVNHPEKVVEALREAGVKITDKPSKRKLASIIVDNLYSNRKFAEEASSLIAQYAIKENPEYANAFGEDAIAAIANAGGAIFTSIGNMVSGSQQKKIAQAQIEAQKEATKRMMIEKAFGKQRRNWIPIVVIGGVLAIGGVVIFMALKSKKQ